MAADVAQTTAQQLSGLAKRCWFWADQVRVGEYPSTSADTELLWQAVKALPRMRSGHSYPLPILLHAVGYSFAMTSRWNAQPALTSPDQRTGQLVEALQRHSIVGADTSEALSAWARGTPQRIVALRTLASDFRGAAELETALAVRPQRGWLPAGKNYAQAELVAPSLHLPLSASLQLIRLRRQALSVCHRMNNILPTGAPVAAPRPPRGSEPPSGRSPRR